MSESNKPANENKPQPPAPQKPEPAKDSFTVGRMIVGDSVEGLRKRSK
ncbi:TPA: hypothetical protein U5D97_003301 [Yersinia enterocolitica]|nr:hypothetical protein [Yersinia intermedia]HDL7932545.1 hypothetical protein [Yersinia enterocolitica]HEN3468486.1 hypothetical protein [Yersinia enterocolitica]